MIQTGSGVYALIAHLKRGSVLVRAGEVVNAGQQVARCGNSGNSSEPHVHAQLMDRASLWTAQGIPLVFTGIRLENDPSPADQLPRNDERMIVE